MTSTKTSSANIALVYDWFDSWGGAERVLLTLDEMFPHAHWYTSYIDYKDAPWARDLTSVHTSFIHSLPFIRKSRLLSAPFYPMAFENFDFSAYDLVISVTSSYAKGIITKPSTKHICYMLTPTRFLWSKKKDYLKDSTRKLVRPYTRYIQEWDKQASQRPDSIIAISKTVQDRIKETYERDSSVVYPPFDTDYWEGTLRKAQRPAGDIPSSFYLLVSRIRPYKKVDIAVRAFNSLKEENLVVVGSGRKKDVAYLKSLAQQNTCFLENVSDHELAYLYSHAKGLIMPQEEDFGYIALEAQACTCPVIAYNKGGATETVKHKKSGYLFNDQSSTGILEAVENYEKLAYTIQRHLQKAGLDEVRPFDKSSFITKFKKAL